MQRQPFLFLLFLTLAAGLIPFTANRLLSPTSSAPAHGKILVSAAASLQNALTAIDLLFETANPTFKVTYNFGSSGALQQQIEQGALVDVFLSAAQKQMNALQQKGLILTETRRSLLTNRLVLIVPGNSTLGLKGFRPLATAKVKKIAVGEFRSVPVGQYAAELFQNLGIADTLKPKLVFGNTVRNVLSAVESGNVDAGIVYATDAKLSKPVKQVATAPAYLHSPIIYPVAVLKTSKQTQAAKAYVQFLSSAQAKAVFRTYGFGTP